ncbi:MAG: LysM peptidoglycan-binding domain-containing protein [Peptococcaceae bacterium]|nr:LysM peptidoglycan-binding domain-containing protein [Peptococcaceae bacterium]
MIEERVCSGEFGCEKRPHLRLVYVNPTYTKAANKNTEGISINHEAENRIVEGRMAKGLTLVFGIGLILFLVVSLSAGGFRGSEGRLPGNDTALTYKPVTIQEGDSLWRLCSQSGLDVSVDTLIARTLDYNGLQGTGLTAGQTIYIPCKD